MTKKEKLAEIEAIKAMLEDEARTLHRLSLPGKSRREVNEGIEELAKKYYAKDVIGVHAHHRSWPVTGRQRPSSHPLKNVRTIGSFYAGMVSELHRFTHFYCTVVWVDVKEDPRTKERFAVGCAVIEALRQLKKDVKWEESEYKPHVCHMSMWVFKKPKPTARRPNPPWKVHFVFGGLPVEGHHLPGGKKYVSKLKTTRKGIGPAGKKLPHFQKLHDELFNKGKREDYEAAWNEFVPPGQEVRGFSCAKWDTAWRRSAKKGDSPFWDLAGWDVVINGCW